MSIPDIRREIDAVDDQLYDLLMTRAELVLKVAAIKRRENLPPAQPGREDAIIARLLDHGKGPLPPESVERIWREIMKAMLRLQTG